MTLKDVSCLTKSLSISKKFGQNPARIFLLMSVQRLEQSESLQVVARSEAERV